MFLKSTMLGLLCLCVTAASSVEAQDFRQLGTRRGALIGAVAGGLIGGHNDEVAAGIIAGGLVGGVTGRVIGNQMNARNYGYGGGYAQQQSYYRPQTYAQPNYGYSQRSYQQHRPIAQPYVQQQYARPYAQPSYNYGSVYQGRNYSGHSVLRRGW